MRCAWVVLLGAIACARPLPAPPPALPRSMVVLPAANRTGDPLPVTGTSVLERWVLHTDRVTVPDVLAAEARRQLAERGFAVVAAAVVDQATGGRVPGSATAAAELARAGGLDGAALFLEVWRWEPDGGTHPDFVLVGVRATFVDPASGRTLWEASHPVAPVRTPGEATLGAAYLDAARAVVADLLAPLAPPR